MSEPWLSEHKTIGRRWLWGILGGAGALIHFGTAFLRLNAFFPYPRLLDFAAFYAGAWAVRLGISPYGLSPEFLESLQAKSGLLMRPPVTYNPPIWSWLLQPLTFLDFPAAAFAWLALDLALIAWSALILAHVAGYDGWRERGLVFLLTLTFGPVFLDLTLGQTSILLLAASLTVGQAVRLRTKDSLFAGTLAQGLAVGAKLFPSVWIGALLLLRRWRLFVLATLAALLALGLGFVITPSGNRDYWTNFLPGRVSSASEQVGIDDQSFVAWLDRLGRPHSFQTPGLSVTQPHAITWSPPWSFSPQVIQGAGYLLVALLALIPLVVLLRAGPARAEGAFYLWVLYWLLPFPHTERYNHVLLLPAMAWLWARSETFAHRGRNLVVLAYFLAGLSRLTHLWAILLPAPWGPLAAGFGLYAVLLLGGGMVTFLRPVKGLQEAAK